MKELIETMVAKKSPRGAADSLTSYTMTIIESARLEGISDPDMVELLRQTITDLKDIRQNLMRHRKVELTKI